jgi:hypothetical protein
MNPRAVLQERYPQADFSIYFRHLEACRGTKRESGRTHEHHICPRKQFPELEHDSNNLITLTSEDHAHAHKLLTAACGISAPPTVLFKAQLAGAAKGGRKGGIVTGETKRNGGRKIKELGIGWFAPGVAAQGGRSLSHEQRQRATSAGGRAAAPLNNHRRWHVQRGIISPTCELCYV